MLQFLERVCIEADVCAFSLLTHTAYYTKHSVPYLPKHTYKCTRTSSILRKAALTLVAVAAFYRNLNLPSLKLTF